MIDISDRSAIDISGKSIAVLGIGRSGTAAAKLGKELGAEMFISDINDSDKIQHSLSELKEYGIEGEAGNHSDRIQESDLIVVSPGIPKTSEVIREAEQSGVPIVGEIEFASWFTDVAIAAVTGSNGKTTTVHLLHEMCSTDSMTSTLAGNIGFPFAEAVINDLNTPTENRVYVLEISSFQMEFTNHFHPHVSIFLNISPDHLDRHADMDEYISMKMKLASNQGSGDFIVYNMDDAILSDIFSTATAAAIPFTLGPDGKIFGVNETKIFDEEHATLIDLDQIALPGRHNLANQLAAASAAHLLGVDHSHISRVMETFAGVEHRLEKVMDINGVTFINDSKATNVDAVNVALESLSTPTILILGGIDKGGDFTPLPHTHNHIKEVIAFGQARNQIQTAIGDAVRFTSVDNLMDAVSVSSEHAENGWTVLLSPGCSSFDQFNNFEERGRTFKKAVAALVDSE